MQRGVPAETSTSTSPRRRPRPSAVPDLHPAPEECIHDRLGFQPATPSTRTGCALQHNIDGWSPTGDLASARNDAGPVRRASFVIDHYQGEPPPSANDLLQDYNFKISS
jgi:hypothetical protein